MIFLQKRSLRLAGVVVKSARRENLLFLVEVSFFRFSFLKSSLRDRRERLFTRTFSVFLKVASSKGFDSLFSGELFVNNRGYDVFHLSTEGGVTTRLIKGFNFVTCEFGFAYLECLFSIVFLLGRLCKSRLSSFHIKMLRNFRRSALRFFFLDSLCRVVLKKIRPFEFIACSIFQFLVGFRSERYAELFGPTSSKLELLSCRL